ncbi:NPCBM/NEW2 domain-containing protein, partial [Emticicia sp.]|uniref:NPCBM/NEW2 domain-containing protein n=1 Tax=Emticicia sp. TaxID=1930953 RepID=UPI003753DCE9
TASNLDWEASESTSWFEIITEDDLSGGAGVSNFKVRATETNNTTSNRSADIAFLLSDGTNKYVTITQSATTGCTQASLSTLNPTNPSGEWQGYGTRQLNKSIDGNTLMVGGYTTGNGIGTHANSTIVYNLSGQYGTFSGSVGRDDEADNCGCGTMKLQFIIKADGATLFTSSLLGTTDARQAFSVDVTGKNTLELIVNDGGDNFWGDHADWLDPVLYCGAAPSCTTAPSAPTNVSSVAGSGGSFTLSATCAAGTVTWSTGAVGNSISVSPTVSTNYSVSCVSGSCPPSNTVSIGVTVNSGACSAISDGLVMGTWNATGQQLVARFFNGQFWLTQRTGSNPDGFVVRGSGMLQRSDVSLANGSYYNLVGCFSWTYSNYDNLGNPPSSVFSTPANYSLGYAEDGTMFYTATTGGGGGGSCIDAYVTNAWASATIGYGSTPQIGYRFDGGAMVMGSTTYTQGIGTHAGSEIIYNFTNNPYANFKASVGRDVDANGCNCPAGSGQTIL